MKKILPLLFAAVLLASCSKSSDDAKPASTPTLEAKWTFQSESVLTTPKNGGAATTTANAIPAGSYTVTFAAGKITSTGGGSTTTGTYTYSGNTLTIPYTSTGGVSRVQTLTVTELTTSKLVTQENIEDTANRYVTTDTYTR